MKKCYFGNAKVGDKVFDVRLGWGEIIDICFEDNGLVYVGFKGWTEAYNLYGVYNISYDKRPSLYWNEFEVPEEAFEKPSPKLEIDTPVLVSSKEGDEGYKRHFAGWTKDGRMKCWRNGHTSWSAGGKEDYSIWNYWKLPEEE